jgi:hypothetical protein
MTTEILWHPKWFQLRKPSVSIFRDMLPDEWFTAISSLRAMNHVAGPLSKSFPRSLLGFTLAFTFGGVPACFFMPTLSATGDSQVALGIMAAVLAFGGLLVGFVVTLMLFTGRLENTARLSYEQVVAYVARLKYLLASQAMTLFSALILSLLTMVWMVLYGIKAPALSMVIVGVTLFGFAGVCLVRVFLLPMQIFELHEESLDSAVEAKLEETNAKYDNQEG